MTTDLHTKKTDKHQFLSPKSCHPKHCSRSIPYSQAIRLKRICSSESKLNYRLGQLKTQLKSRGYKTKNITDAFDKAQEKDRASLMEYKNKATRADRIPFVVTFHPDLTNISSTIRKHWRLIENDSSLKEIFPSPPVIAYRRPKNLKDILVTSKVKKQETSKFGCYKQCGRSNCKCCKAANTDHSFSSTVTKQRYNNYVTSNCKTENSIYILTCGTCKLQYVGETETEFNIRLNNHRSFYTKGRNCPITRHLLRTGHTFDNITFQIIEVNQNWDSERRKQRERFWMHQLRTLGPDGLNERDEKQFYPKPKE